MNQRLELKVKQTNGRYRLATNPEIVNIAKTIIYAELEQRQPMTDSSTVREFLKHHFYGAERETFAVMFLDNQHRIIAFEELFQGTIDSAPVYPREVAKAALRYNAAALILAHTHPSGDTTPSRADIAITKRLVEALGLFDIRVIDHIIASGANAVSLAEHGLM